MDLVNRKTRSFALVLCLSTVLIISSHVISAAASPSADSLTPASITTTPGAAQSFTAVYSDADGWQSLSDTTLYIAGGTHNEWVHYSPAANRFTLTGVNGNCAPGQGTTLSSGFLTLNCNASSAFGSGNTLTVTFNLTPQPSFSPAQYTLVIGALDQSGASDGKFGGNWTVNQSPSVDSLTPVDITTNPGVPQSFTAVYSDPDGWQNIAAANFYLSGNGGTHNEWLHYLVAPNLFTMMGTNDFCSPGQAKTI